MLSNEITRPPTVTLPDYKCEARVESIKYMSDGTASTDVIVTMKKSSFTLSDGHSDKFEFTAVGKAIPARLKDTVVVEIGFHVGGVKATSQYLYL